MSIYIGDKEIKNLYAGGSISISDMQGPCPDGFHVPLSSEWVALCGVLTSTFGLAGNSTTMGTYLKMPMVGDRKFSNADVDSQGTLGLYWSSSRYNTNNAYTLSFASNLTPQNTFFCAYGLPIRSFKNVPVMPTSSWTVLYQGSGNAGVFWNSTDGLISVSGDGTTWYTIQDKNLGATTVYNQGDTLTDANCGNFYQWGNNYGFAHSGTVTTSSTRVNASNYGPGNYYSSSTFIIISSSPYDRSSVQTDNLRGGVSQGTTEKGAAKEVYLGETKVRPSADTRTFTISRTEKSNMSSGWTYSDDAAGLTAGDSAFDEFFGYSAVLLDANGNETAEVKQTTPGVLDLSQLGTLTGGDNVMIKFPVMGVKMSKSGNVVTLSLTKELNKDGYQYYAFNRDGSIQNQMYLGVFKGTSDSSKLRSRATNAKPTVSRSITNFRNTDVITGYGSSSHYSLITLPIRNYVNALYMMKYGNPYSQSIIGKGYTGGSAAQVLGTTVTGISGNLATGATNTSSTGRVRLFGLEDWWGNIHEWVDGIYGNYVNMTNNPSKLKELGNTSYGWERLGSATSISGNITSIVGNDKGMFFPSACSGSNYTTYYCDYGDVNASKVAYAGGDWSTASIAGAFCLYVSLSATYTSAYIGARLAYI